MLETGRIIPGNSDVLGVSYGDDAGLYVEFYMRPVENTKRSLEEGRPIFENKEYVKIMAAGNKSSIIDRPVLKTASGQVPPDNLRFPRQWQAFKNQENQALDGTPVTEWPPITPADAMMLKGLNILTVEALAALPDHALNWMGARKYRDMAINWIAKAKDGAQASKWAAEKAEMQAQIDALKNQMAGLQNSGLIMKPPSVEYQQQEASAPPIVKRKGRPPMVREDEQDIPRTDAASGQ